LNIYLLESFLKNSLSPYAWVDLTELKLSHPLTAEIITHLAKSDEQYLPLSIRQDLYVTLINGVSFSGNLLHWAILFNKPKAVKQLLKLYKTLPRVDNLNHPLEIPCFHTSQYNLLMLMFMTMVLVYFWGFTGILSFFVLGYILKMMKIDLSYYTGRLVGSLPSLDSLDGEQLARRLGHQECLIEFEMVGITYQKRSSGSLTSRIASWEKEQRAADYNAFINGVNLLTDENIPIIESG